MKNKTPQYILDMDRPEQYRKGIDTFTRAKANMTTDEILACCKFNIDKYCWREKNQDMADYQKIKAYCDLAIEVLEKDLSDLIDREINND